MSETRVIAVEVVEVGLADGLIGYGAVAEKVELRMSPVFLVRASGRRGLPLFTWGN